MTNKQAISNIERLYPFVSEELKKSFDIALNMLRDYPTDTEIQADMQKTYLAQNQEAGNGQKAQWVYTEFTKTYDGGGFLQLKGYKCSNCGFFRHKKKGKSNFCEVCGADLREVNNETNRR